MPLVKINMLAGKSEKYKKAVLDAVHDALMEAIDIPDDDRFQRIVEFPKDDFEYSAEKTSGFMLIEIKMFPGRTKAEKGAVIKTVTKKLVENVGVEAADVFIIIDEPLLENWGMRGIQLGGD